METDFSLETLKCALFTSLILGREGGERRKGRREEKEKERATVCTEYEQ